MEDYQSKLWPETETVYVVSDGQVVQPLTTAAGQAESETITVPFIIPTLPVEISTRFMIVLYNKKIWEELTCLLSYISLQ
jgi:hypothetical protein